MPALRCSFGNGAGTSPSAFRVKISDRQCPAAVSGRPASGGGIRRCPRPSVRNPSGKRRGNPGKRHPGGPDRRLGRLRFRCDSRRPGGGAAILHPVPGPESAGRSRLHRDTASRSASARAGTGERMCRRLSTWPPESPPAVFGISGEGHRLWLSPARGDAAAGAAHHPGRGAVRRAGARRADHPRGPRQGRGPRHPHRRGGHGRSIPWARPDYWRRRLAANRAT